MTPLLRCLAMLAAGLLVAVADALLKRVALDAHPSGSTAARAPFGNPLMVAVVLLYAGQIAFFLYVFGRRMQLGIAGNLQMAAYSSATLLLSVMWFRERLSAAQMIGILLALVGSLLMVRDVG